MNELIADPGFRSRETEEIPEEPVGFSRKRSQLIQEILKMNRSQGRQKLAEGLTE